MPRVDFYLLEQHVPNGKLRAVCRLSQKIYSLGHKALIQTSDVEQARALDDLLWTNDEGSFLPHCIQDDNDENPESPLVICSRPPASYEQDVLISLLETIPEYYGRYERICEIVDHTPADKESGRERFRLYRNYGCTLDHHNIHP